MRRWLAAVGAVCALGGAGSAQQMAGGKAVGTAYRLSPVGSRVQAAAPQAGNRVPSPFNKPYDPNRPLDVFKGTNIDPSSVVAPVSGLPGTQHTSLLGKLTSKLNSVTNFFTPSTPKPTRPRITPGIYRRDRERARMRNFRYD